MGRRDRCLAMGRQYAVQQEIAGGGGQIDPHPAVAAIGKEGVAGMDVDLGGKGVAVIGGGGIGAPPVEPDIGLVGRMARRHPVGLGNAQHLEEPLERRG